MNICVCLYLCMGLGTLPPVVALGTYLSYVRVVFLFSLYSMFSVGLYEDCRPFDDNYSLQVGYDSQLEPCILY